MSYRVILSSQAHRDLDRFYGEVHKRLLSAIKQLSENPRPNDCRKMQGTVNEWRIRVGEYRIIYTIDDSERKILVIRMGHRQNVYEA